MNDQAPKKACVIGWPIDHSLSPLIHGFWLNELCIAGEYVRLPVKPEDLMGALKKLGDQGFVGANITVPHKVAAMGALDEVDPMAKRIGAVNTVTVGSDGMLSGANTDGFGFIENLLAAQPDLDFTKAPAVVLGAGGAARAVVAALLSAGTPEVRLANRTLEKAKAIADDFKNDFAGVVNPVKWDGRNDALEGAGLLVNTTTLGMKGQPQLEIALDALPAGATVNDIVYTPLETDLLASARGRGNPVVDGLGMLLHQARPGFEAWFGGAPTVTEALRHHVLSGGQP